MKRLILAVAAFFTLASAAIAQPAPYTTAADFGEIEQPEAPPPPVVTQPVRPAPAPPPVRVERPRPQPTSYVAPVRQRPTAPSAIVPTSSKSEASRRERPQAYAPAPPPAAVQPPPAGWKYDARITRSRCQLGYGRMRFVDEARRAGYQGCYVPPGGLAQPPEYQRQRAAPPRRQTYRPRPSRPIYQPRR